MAVRIIYGAPRSGKTYYAVNHLVKTYFNQGADGLYSLKSKFLNLQIFTNIDNLKLPHKNLSEAIRTVGTPEKFFAYEYQEKIFRKYPQVCYFIDEAQMIFPDNFRDNKVFNWFQYHGHWGQDIYLMTQDIKLLPRQITVLSEITIKALPRSTSLFGGRDLRYNMMLGAGQEIGDKMVLVKKQKIFDLYCSQMSSEAVKVRNPLVKYLAILFVFLLFAGWNVQRLLAGWTKDIDPSIPPDQEIPVSYTPGSPAAGSKVSSNMDQEIQPPVDPLTWVSVSFLTQQNTLFIVCNGALIPASDLPYRVKQGLFRQILVEVPQSKIAMFLNIEKDEKKDNVRVETVL